MNAKAETIGKIRQFLTKHKNREFTEKEIAEGAGLSERYVKSVLKKMLVRGGAVVVTENGKYALGDVEAFKAIEQRADRKLEIVARRRVKSRLHHEVEKLSAEIANLKTTKDPNTVLNALCDVLAAKVVEAGTMIANARKETRAKYAKGELDLVKSVVETIGAARAEENGNAVA